MNLVVVVLLGVLWASILVPGVLRDRRRRSPSNSIDAFERSMGILANDLHARTPGHGSQTVATGRHVLVVADPARLARRPARLRTLRRRRQMLQGLALVTVLAALAAVVAGEWTVWLFAATGTALVAYVAVLARIRAREADARRTVRPLPAAADLRRGARRVAHRDAVADSPA